MSGIGHPGSPPTLLQKLLLGDLEIGEIDGKHRDYKGLQHNGANRAKARRRKEFIAWDGEGIEHTPSRVPSEFIRQWLTTYIDLNGEDETTEKAFREWDFEKPEPQPYVLLANSKDRPITRQEGLQTDECLEFILNTKKRYPESIFVGFGFNYDAAQILADLPIRKLERIYKTNRCTYKQYNIQWMPRRWFRVTDRFAKVTATIDDVFAFFQTSFYNVCVEFLGKDDPDLRTIEDGKAARQTFRWEELDDFIIPYNRCELKMLVRIMNKLRDSFHYIDLDLPRWYGPGVVASSLFRKHKIKQHMAETPEEVNDAARYAYAGGRFEQFKLGRHPNTVYEYDIRSAYPAAAIRLPSLSSGTWERVESFEPGTFGVWHISYTERETTDRPQPLFCRAENGLISFPTQVEGWYWTPEADLVPDCVQYGFVWRETSGEKPFNFIEGMYAQRQTYKRQGNPAQYPVKVSLNSIYGKMAQRSGWKDGPPTWHQLEWAGFITSYTRSLLHKALLVKPESIIACETDAVFSTEPLDLDVGPNLGQWELTTFKEITYLQSGFYYAICEDGSVLCKYRGMDRDRATQQPTGLPFGRVLDHLSVDRRAIDWRTPPLLSSTTRFINVGLALQTASTFRTWETNPKKLSLDQDSHRSKRYHLGRECPECQAGRTLSQTLHPMRIGGHLGTSHRHTLPWLTDGPDDVLVHMLKMEEADRWQ